MEKRSCAARTQNATKKPRNAGSLEEDNPCPEGADEDCGDPVQPICGLSIDHLADTAPQAQCVELEKQEPQELAEDNGESVISDVIRFGKSVRSDLSGDPLNGPQCSKGDAPEKGTNDQEDCAAPPSCKIRKSSASGEADAKRRRQSAEGGMAQPLSAQRPPEGGTQAQEGCMFDLPPSRVRKLSLHDLSVENKKRRCNRKRKLDLQHDVGQKRICFRIPNPGHEIEVPGPPPEVLEAGALLSTVSGTEGQQQGSVLQARGARAVPLRGAAGPPL